MRLNLYYPAKPYVVTQAFGILNSSYKDNGINMLRHNGIDFRVDTDGVVRAMCDLEVYEVGENSKAGKYVRLKTTKPVEAEGRTGIVAFMYMHAASHLCKKGDKLQVGDAVIVADNTGFSTGPHTHISAYWIDQNNVKLSIGDLDIDYCFDFAPYYNGKFADDVLIELYKTLLGLYQKLLVFFK